MIAVHNGTETSIAAARQIAGSAATLRAQVLGYLIDRGEQGATDDEIQRALGMGGSTERPRRIELQALGLVADLGQRRATASGRAAVVWHAREKP